MMRRHIVLILCCFLHQVLKERGEHTIHLRAWPGQFNPHIRGRWLRWPNLTLTVAKVNETSRISAPAEEPSKCGDTPRKVRNDCATWADARLTCLTMSVASVSLRVTPTVPVVPPFRRFRESIASHTGAAARS